MDVQLHGLYSQEHFSGWFVDFIHSRGIGDLTLKELRAQFIPILDSVLYHSKRQTSLKDTTQLKSFQKKLDLIKDELITQGLSNEFEMQVIKSLQSQVYLMLSRNGSSIRKGAQERDKQMADNLSWLIANKLKGRKVIVWAASSHIYKTSFEPVAKISPERFYPMGYYFTKQNTTLPVYILGFTSYQGISKRVGHKSYSFESREPNSFEEWVNSKGADFAFIDLEKVRTSVGKRQAFLMAGAGHIQTEQYWMEGFNGVFYIKKMEPCTLKE